MKVLFFGTLIGVVVLKHWNERVEANRPLIVPQVAGTLEQPLFGDQVLHIIVWHQFPGTVRNGTLTIHTTSPLVLEWDRLQIHSFEAWEPNRDQQVTFDLALTNFNPTTEIPLDVQITAANGRPHLHTATWLGETWKSLQTR